MKQNSTNEKIFNFLTNQPLGEDLFENKSQDKIAQIISEKIIDNPKFKIIGIDGEWGSGKSNLVRLVQKKLNNTHSFFIYDVWGHQEDDQRHSILSEITDFITSNNIIKEKNNWNEKLNKLVSKQKNTTTTNIPHLSIGFIISLLLIIYVPTVNTFAKDLNIYWKIPIVLLPILLLFILFIRYYLQSVAEEAQPCINEKDKPQGLNKFKKYSLEASQKLFKIYNNNKIDETKIEIISEKEPTVKEFRNWMREIDNDLNQKIVIIFDNFDRLPKKHILNIWSSIHIFFAEETYSNIKVIIPFDKEHIQNAFNDLNSSLNTKFGDDYINKTFDIVFRITLPIMSNWKKFFAEQWKKSFINYDEDELKLVIQVFEFLNRRITPREIISFINEILTIKLLDDNFKERYIAIFVLKKDEILKNPLKAISNLEYLKGLHSFYSNDSDFAKQITAIVYHIDVENALELIYTQELKDSLNKNDTKKFNLICKSEFIDSIYYAAITELEVLENPIKTFSKLDKETNLSTLNINRTWSFFYDRILHQEPESSRLFIEDWQLILLQNISDDQYLTNLIIRFASLLDDSNVLMYVELIDELRKNVDYHKVSDLLIETMIDAKGFVELVEYKGEEYRTYRIKTNGKDLDEYLVGLGTKNIIELSHSKILAQNFDLNKYKEHLKTNFINYSKENSIQIANDFLYKLKETIKPSEIFKDILDQSTLHSLYANNQKLNLPIINDMIAMRIAKGSNFNTSYIPTFQPVLNSENEEIADDLASKILTYITYEDLLLLSKDFVDASLFRQMIIKIFSNPSLDKNTSLFKLIANYPVIKANLKINDTSLLKELNISKIDNENFEIDNLDDEFISDCFIDPDLRISKSFVKKFNSDFKLLSEDGYKVVFGDGTDIHFRYFYKLETDSLTQSSLDIFEKQFLAKIKEDKLDEKWWDIFRIYESNNSQLSIINSLKNIRDQFLNSNINLSLKIAKILLPYFIKHDLLLGLNDVFRLIIKNEFLYDNEFIEMLIVNSNSIKNLYQNANQSDKEGFRNMINETRENNNLLEQLAKQIDIRKLKGKTEN